jgi:hypothetical protein
MSAIKQWSDSAAASIDCITFSKFGLVMDGLAFFGSMPVGDEPPAPRFADLYADSFAFDGQLPVSCIEQYVGDHPERLVEGFTDMIKPRGCDWMSRSRVKAITNHKGTIMVLLEQAA